MKKYLLFVITISICIVAKSQGTYYSDYSLTPYSGSGYISEISYAGLITKASDGNYMGVSDKTGGGAKIIYKIDATTGNMIWRKELPQITSGDPLSLVAITTLSDNSIGVLFFSFSSTYNGLVAKIDNNGSVLWTHGLYIGTSASFSTIVPTTDGGLIVSGGGCSGSDMIIHMNSSGTIVSQHAHYGTINGFAIYNNDMVPDGNNQYTCWGYKFVSGSQNGMPFAFYQCDSSGTITNATVFDCGIYGANTWVGGNKLLCTATHNGHYAIQPINQMNLANNKTALFYFNNQHQRVWSKLISVPTDSSAYPMCVTPTSDNGVIVCIQRMYDLSAGQGVGYIKFDSTGNVVWAKCVANLSSSHWQYTGFGRMINVGGAMVSTMNHVFGIDVCKTDEDLNGFCNYTTFNPVITTLTPTVTTDVMAAYNLTFQSVNVNWTGSTQATNRYTECSTNGIETAEENQIQIFPIPADDKLMIQNTEGLINQMEVYDVTGKLVANHFLNSGINQISVSELSNGIYLIKEISFDDVVEVKKLIIQH